MTLPAAAAPGTLLIFGPPGAGVPLVVAERRRLNFSALGWEGRPGEELPVDPASPGDDPIRLALEATDLACLQRSQPPWAAVPLEADRETAAATLADCRERIFPARLRADLVLDTTQVSARVLLAQVRQLEPYLGPERVPVPVLLETFSYPRGVPLDLDWCMDVRVLRNPYWEPRLRFLSGLDPNVQEFVLEQELAQRIVASTLDLVAALRPALRDRTRRRVLRVAVGCTGGFHRSVAVAEALGQRLRASGVETLIWHRDLPERA